MNDDRLNALIEQVDRLVEVVDYINDWSTYRGYPTTQAEVTAEIRDKLKEIKYEIRQI